MQRMEGEGNGMQHHGLDEGVRRECSLRHSLCYAHYDDLRFLARVGILSAIL